MPKTLSLQNNFVGGLKTEFTGLNFPENACTDADNCVFTITGDVNRRLGINNNGNLVPIPDTNSSMNTYRWRNAGGDGESEILIVQTGAFLTFLRSSASTIAAPVGNQLMSQQDISVFRVAGSTQDVSTEECQFADGNGFLFIFHPFCEPMFATFNPNSGVVQISTITLQVRDFSGFNDNLPTTFRPVTLTAEHQYNLLNQGWATSSAFWSATPSDQIPLIHTSPSQPNNLIPNITASPFGFNSSTITVPGNVVIGQAVVITGQAFSAFVGKNYTTNVTLYGTVASLGGGIININMTGSFVQGVTTPGLNYIPSDVPGVFAFSWTMVPANTAANLITTWHTAFNNYPSNADIWFDYKDTGGIFNPAATAGSVVQPQAQAPRGHFVVQAFSQNFSGISGISGLTGLSTNFRPNTGCWFQGRVWYAGVNDSQPATGDQSYYTWTENIYFSQIITSQSKPQFGNCFQENDPTNEDFADLLPTDGGVITIQGSGNVMKLFPIANGILVFASNGIWMITGNQGFGFTADDFSVFKISGVQSISPTSVIDVNGLPMFWNQEGIYAIQQSQGNAPYKFGGFQVDAVTVGTILEFYDEIPSASKLYVRGDYDPINYIASWVFRSTPETGIADRYHFDRSLSLNVYNKAFYPYTFANNGFDYVSDLIYLSYPPGAVAATSSPPPIFKYIAQHGPNFLSFAEENDATYKDWAFFSNSDYTSFWVAGYSLQGKAVYKWQPVIVEMFTRGANQYKIQGIWDYTTSGNTGRFSSLQLVVNPNNVTYQSGISGPDLTDYAMYYRRHKIRGYGTALQIKMSSVSGEPFDVMGWGVLNEVNPGI